MCLRSCLWLLLAATLLAACEDMGIMVDSRPGKKDGVVRLDGRRDAGPGNDVVIGNEGGVYAYELTSGADKLVVVLNRSDVDQTINLQASSYTDLLNGGTMAGSSLKTPARTARILQ